MGTLQDFAGQLLGGHSADPQAANQHGEMEQILGLINHPDVGGISGLAALLDVYW